MPVDELTDVLALKRRLEVLCGSPRFRQLLLHAGESLDDGVLLNRPMDVQLLLLPFSTASPAQVAELLAAAAQGRVSQVERILQRPQDPGLTTAEDARMPLAEAARSGHVEIAHLLLEAGADANKTHLLVPGGPEKLRGTALSDASFQGHIEVVQLLLDAGANPYKGGNFGNAIALASQRGHVDILLLLLKEEYLEVNESRDYCYLVWAGSSGQAAHYGQQEVLKLFWVKFEAARQIELGHARKCSERCWLGCFVPCSLPCTYHIVLALAAMMRRWRVSEN